PLRKIQMFSDFIKRTAQDSMDSTSLDYIERMQKTTGWMQQLIRDLLDLSRVTRKGGAFVKTDLRPIIRHVLENLQGAISTTRARMNIGEMITLEADEIQMQELLQNLLENSLKFHGGKPPFVTVSSRYVDDDFCEITIQDQGIGFKTDHKERIFQMFERLHGE